MTRLAELRRAADCCRDVVAHAREGIAAAGPSFILVVAGDEVGADVADGSPRGLEGAKLNGVGLEAAQLSRARLEGAFLQFARLEGASIGGAQLQGADLDTALLTAASLTRAEVWRARGDPFLDLAEISSVDEKKKPWESILRPFSNFAAWRDEILESIPLDIRGEVTDRLSVLDPEREEPERLVKWDQPEAPGARDELDKRRADFLLSLTCKNELGPYAARGLLRYQNLQTCYSCGPR